MISPLRRTFITIAFLSAICFISSGQSSFNIGSDNTRPDKPYKILTSGKQVTVKSAKEIKSVIVWTATGHRVVEEKAVNANSFSFTLNVAEKVFFIMIQYEGSKPFTEKIGIQ